MKDKVKFIARSAMIAALYAALAYLQDFIFPESGSSMIQFRVAEALNVLAFFTPAAIPGLSLGCLLFNLMYVGALPLDFLVGTLATLLGALCMWGTRKVTVKGYPILGMIMPALWNSILVGWELSHYIGGGFWMNAGYVALGELGVLLSLGTLLFYTMKRRKLQFLFN